MSKKPHIIVRCFYLMIVILFSAITYANNMKVFAFALAYQCIN
jgi:hypothetical protein